MITMSACISDYELTSLPWRSWLIVFVYDSIVVLIMNETKNLLDCKYVRRPDASVTVFESCSADCRTSSVSMI